ncbi:hypothetical protein JVU11DRAFT_9756 [Chiua virens]|nr:hypothetical protein JVU11DRAFT_9756 [Chiua virens]
MSAPAVSSFPISASGSHMGSPTMSGPPMGAPSMSGAPNMHGGPSPSGGPGSMPGGPSASGAPSFKAPPYDLISSFLVYEVNILILIILGAFALFTLPRAISRLARRSEWFHGHRLYSTDMSRRHRINISIRRSTNFNTHSVNLNTYSIFTHSDPKKAVLDLDGGSTEAIHTAAPYFGQWGQNEKALPPRPVTLTFMEPAIKQQPWHMPMVSSLVLPVSNFLSRRVDGGSLGLFLVKQLYTMFVIGAMQAGSSLLDFNRTGWVCASQLPFVYILATKNNVVGMLVGVGYEKLNSLHRTGGTLAIVAANAHAIGYFYSWSIQFTLFEYLMKPSVQWAFLALLFLDILAIFSMSGIRTKCYNLFFVSHVVGSVGFLVAVYCHSPVVRPYILVAVIFYGADQLVRTLKTRITTATLRPIPELGLTRVELSSLNDGWRVGQHVRLRVLSRSMGLLGWTESHPFMIANVNRTEEGLVLMCKKVGKWTGRMYEAANTSTYGESGKELGKNVRVMVEGPYGGLGHTVIKSYSAAVLVGGGGGLTFALAAVQELVRSGKHASVTEIDLIWCIADPGSLVPMIPLFTSLISQSTTTRLCISVYYGLAVPASAFEGLYLPSGITLEPGRPNFCKHLDSIVSATTAGGGCSGVFVGVCGPTPLANDVSQSVRSFDSRRRRAVGGIEFHEESFQW